MHSAETILLTGVCSLIRSKCGEALPTIVMTDITAIIAREWLGLMTLVLGIKYKIVLLNIAVVCYAYCRNLCLRRRTPSKRNVTS